MAWFGVFAPAKSPAAVVGRLGEAARTAGAQPDRVQGLGDFGMTARSSSAQELADRIRAENAQWRGHVKDIGFTADT